MYLGKIQKERDLLNLKIDYMVEFQNCIYDLVRNEKVQSMKEFLQHKNSNCLEHCLKVAYHSYVICRRLGLDYCSAARGGLLHDFFLYDWHVKGAHKGLHGFVHPKIALANANQHFGLNKKEKDIIMKHMWPLTIKLPRYKETFVVMLVDKYCAVKEFFVKGKRSPIRLNLVTE